MSDLEKILEVQFQNPELLTEALTHRSYLNEDHNTRASNERLEFLGDSVLSLLTSGQLFRLFPNYPEGKLTSLRSTLVRAETLGKIANELRLGEFLRLSRGEEKEGGRQNLSLLANTFEAVLGAIYLDQGLVEAERFLQKNLLSKIDELSKASTVADYKSRLQEISQERYKAAPVYSVTREEGPDHEKTFEITVSLANNPIASGVGRNKLSAEQLAAKVALEKLEAS